VVLSAVPPLKATGDVVSVDTGSRDVTPATAAEIVARCAAKIPPDVPLFKKIDSTLRGSIVEEVRAAAFGRSKVVVAPAVPLQGRTVRDGTVHLRGVPIEDTRAATFASRLAMALAPLPCDMPDCATDEELAAIARAASADTLLVGAAGLAQAVAQIRFGDVVINEPPTGAWPVLFVAGSRTDMTAPQIARLREARPDIDILLPPSMRQTIDEVAKDMAEAAVERLRRARFGAIFLTGGHTARAVLDRLGVSALSVRGHVVPGIPWGEAEIEGSSILVATKAGGFGAPDTLINVVKRLEKGAPAASRY
jgi:D-threonate/D-erythronate kinase